MDIQEQKRTSSVTLPQSVMLAKQAKREMESHCVVSKMQKSPNRNNDFER